MSYLVTVSGKSLSCRLLLAYAVSHNAMALCLSKPPPMLGHDEDVDDYSLRISRAQAHYLVLFSGRAWAYRLDRTFKLNLKPSFDALLTARTRRDRLDE